MSEPQRRPRFNLRTVFEQLQDLEHVPQRRTRVVFCPHEKSSHFDSWEATLQISRKQHDPYPQHLTQDLVKKRKKESNQEGNSLTARPKAGTFGPKKGPPPTTQSGSLELEKVIPSFWSRDGFIIRMECVSVFHISRKKIELSAGAAGLGINRQFGNVLGLKLNFQRFAEFRKFMYIFYVWIFKKKKKYMLSWPKRWLYAAIKKSGWKKNNYR